MLLSFDDCLANVVTGEEMRCINSLFVIVKGEMGSLCDLLFSNKITIYVITFCYYVYNVVS